MKQKQLKKINKFVCCLVILSLFLQFLPAREPAQATWLETAGKWLEKLVTKVALPDITLTEKGELKVGSYRLLKELACIKDKDGKCVDYVNPFSQFRLSMDGKEVKSQIALVEPVVIPGCGAMTEEIWSEATDAFTPAAIPNAILDKLDPIYITKQITGCTATPCLEPQLTCDAGCPDQGVTCYGVAWIAKKESVGCYDWYMGGDYGNEKESDFSEDNVTWRLYWEGLGETLGTYENIKKAYIYCEENEPVCRNWQSLAEALTDLGGNVAVVDLTPQFIPKYKNLYEYNYPNGQPRNNTTIKSRHVYFLKKMSAIMPSLTDLSALNIVAEKLNWWGPDGAYSTGRRSARRAIKTAIDSLQAGIKKDLTIFGLTIEEIKTISAKAAQLLEESKASPACINSKKGELTIPKPSLPEICELSIPLPGDNKCEGFDNKCESKILAKNKACIYLNRLQQSAAQEVYSAFKIFNATDPFTDCLFVRNCRTNCSLRIGELTFTVSLLDVAALFIPGGFLNVIQKILNIAKMINQAWEIYTTIKEALNSGVTFLNDLFKVMGSLSSMYASFTNLGLNWSDMLIYGVGSVAAQKGGAALQKIGVSEGGNIGWLKATGGKALGAGDGLLGGVAAVTVLNIDKVGQAVNGMQDMLGNFAQNNLKFAAAKSAAIKANEKLKGSVDEIRTKFKAEPEFSFFFKTEGTVETTETSIKKKELNTILGDFQLFFRSVDEFMNDIAQTAKLKDGTNISSVQKGSDQSQEEKDLCSNLGADCPATAKKVACEEGIIKEFDEEGNYTGEWFPKTFNLDFSGDVTPSFHTENISGYNNAMYFCNLNRVAIKKGINNCEWLDLFKTATEKAGDWKNFFKLLDPDYIKKAIQEDLNCYETSGDCDLDYNSKSWREYWEELGRTMGTPENIMAQYDWADLSTTLTTTEKSNVMAVCSDALRDLYGQYSFAEIKDFIANKISPQKNTNLSDYYTTVTKCKYKGVDYTGMEARHVCLEGDMSGIFPMLSNLASIETYIDTNNEGWASTKTMIDVQLRALQRDIQKDIMMFSAGGLGATQADIARLNSCIVGPPPIGALYSNKQYFENIWFVSDTVTPDVLPVTNTNRSHLVNFDDKWNESYNADLAYEAWDEKINVLTSNYNHFQDVEEALSLGVSPEKPIVVYKIAKANKILEEIKTTANTLNDNNTDWTKVANQIIDSIIYGTPTKAGVVCSYKDCPASGCVNLDLESHVDLIDNCAGGIYQTQIFKYKDDYLNYVNCCKSESRGETGNSCCNYSYQSFGKLSCDVGVSKAGEDYAYWANRCDNVAPVVKKYKCSDTSCVRDDKNGTYLKSDCDNECKIASPKYKCSGDPFYECEVDDSGSGVSWNSCINSCENPNQMYACSGWPDYACRPDDNGDYTNDYCDHECGGGGAIKYDCVYGECKEISGGNYTNSNCDNECQTPLPSSNKACGSAPYTTLWCLCPANFINKGVATNACIGSWPDPCIYKSKVECSAILNPVNRKYKCSGTNCVRDDLRGTYTSSDCDGDCGGGSGGGDSCVKCTNSWGAETYCHPKCGQNCWSREIDCESDAQGKSASPFAKIKSIIQKFVKIPQVFAQDVVNFNCENKKFYDSLQKCYSTYDEKYKDGFIAFDVGKKMVADFELQRGDLKKAIEAAATALQNASSILGGKFNQLQDDWNAPLDQFASENQESATARAQIDKILKLKTNSEGILNETIPAVLDQIEAAQTNYESIQEVIRMARAKNLDENTIKSLQDIADKFKEAIGIINVDVIDFTYQKIGPKDIGANYRCVEGRTEFLYRLKCFEEDNKRTFDQLITYTEILRNVENAAFGLTQAGENIKAIEPSMDMTPVTIKPNLINEVDERAQCCRSDCKTGDKATDNKCEYISYSIINEKGDTRENLPHGKCSSNGWTTKKCKEKTSLYVGQRKEDSNYEFFKTNLLANPLSTLEDRFNILSASINNYVMPSMQEAFSGVPKTDTKPAKDALIKSNNVDVDEKKYKDLSDEVLKQARYMWWDLIWGNETVSQELLPACNITEQILTNDPADIQNQCIARPKNPDNISLLPPEAGGGNTLDKYNELKNQCSALVNIDLDVLDNLKVNSNYIQDRIDELNKMRKGIGINKTACPKWFCLNPKTFTRGAGMAIKDPNDPNDLYDQHCVDNCGDKEKPGTWCDINAGIIWDTAQVVGPITDANQVKPEVCELAGIGYDSIFHTYSCNRGDLNVQCSRMMSVDMNEFNKVPPCVKDSRITEMQTLEQNRLKVGVESCANGFCNNRTDGNIACPDWICVNPIPPNPLLPLQKLALNTSSITTDPYCADVKDGRVPGKTLKNNAVFDNILAPKVWQRNWPPDQVCKDNNGACISGITVEPTDGNTYGPGLGGEWTHKCISRSPYEVNFGSSQLRLKELQEIGGGLVASCPSDNWPCKTKESCENLQKVCGQLQDNTALKGTTASGDWVWPPEGLANYISVENACISTQQETVVNLTAFQDMLRNIGAIDASGGVIVGKIDELTNSCNNLNYQKDFARDCYDFSVLQKALNSESEIINENWKEWNKDKDDYTTDPPKWNPDTEKTSTGSWTSEKTDVENTKKDINGFCRSKNATKGKIITETINSDINDIDGFFDCNILTGILPLVDSISVDLTASTEKAQQAREVALKLCSQSTTDMRTPLNEIMRVFSVLLGVKSGTASMNGLSALYFDAQKIRQRAEDVINLIKEAPKKFAELWNSKDEINKIGKDNVKIKPVKCISGPMISYAQGSKPLTGANGGQVCPNVGDQFSQLDSSFSQIRQDLRMIDMARRQPSKIIGLGNLSIKIDVYPIDPDLNEVVSPIYERAKEIKEKSQLLWALATAINYANENCTCGQSYCPQLGPVPLCISGLPLTLTPLKQPFCHLIWTLRYPLGSLAEKLKQELETK